MIIQQKYIRSLGRHLPNTNEGSRLVVAIPIDDQTENLMRTMGFSIPPVVGETLLPPASMGKYSSINAEGDYRIRRDLPKETVFYPIEWHWVEFRGGGQTEEMTDIRYRPVERYPREFREPPAIEISVVPNAENQLMLASSSIPFSIQNDRALLITINMFLQIFGIVHVLDENLIPLFPRQLQRLNWTILPEGHYPWERLQEHAEPILAKASVGKRPVIQNRLETISRYQPDFAAVGRAGFSGYFVFGFQAKGLYICESAYYGNATYVFDEDWQELSRMTKAQILNQDLQRDRLVHVNGWHDRVRELLS